MDAVKEYKISEESAEKQIDILTGGSVVEIEDITDNATKQGLLSSRNVLKRAIRKGFLEISVSKDGEVKTTQHLQKATGQINYKEMSGQAKIIMGKSNEENNYERVYTLLGYLSGLGIDGIVKLKGVDLSIAECLSAVFLGV